MTATNPNGLLRLALLADAATCAAMGLLLAAFAGALAVPLGLPETMLRVIGVILLPWAAWVASVGRAAPPNPTAVRAVIAINAIWVLDSLLLAGGARLFGLAPTGLGVAFVLVQAAASAAITAVQAVALRRAPAVA